LPLMRQAGAAGWRTGDADETADEVEFKIYGEDLQFVEIMLDPGETVMAEAGAMMYMDSAIEMDTVFGTVPVATRARGSWGSWFPPASAPSQVKASS